MKVGEIYHDPDEGSNYVILAIGNGQVTVCWFDSIKRNPPITFNIILTEGDEYVGQASELFMLLL